MTGDEVSLRDLLTQDVVMHADGGGKVSANLNPVFGLEKAVRLLLGIRKKWPPPEGTTARLARINGQPGIVLSARRRGVPDHGPGDRRWPHRGGLHDAQSRQAGAAEFVAEAQDAPPLGGAVGGAD
jgi:hypothetical protein